MAQVMHYCSYPESGYGSDGYNHWEYGYQYADFGDAGKKHDYDYDVWDCSWGAVFWGLNGCCWSQKGDNFWFVDLYGGEFFSVFCR